MKKNQNNGDRRVGIFKDWPVQEHVVVEGQHQLADVPKKENPKGKTLSKRLGNANPYQQGRNRE